MDKYAAIRISAKNTVQNVSEQTERYENCAYGICSFSYSNGLLDIKDCVCDISDDISWLRALADKLNLYDVDPVHFYDIIEDELYNIKTNAK